LVFKLRTCVHEMWRSLTIVSPHSINKHGKHGGLGGGEGRAKAAAGWEVAMAAAVRVVRVVGMEEAVKAAEGKAVARVVAAREEGTAVKAGRW